MSGSTTPTPASQPLASANTPVGTATTVVIAGTALLQYSMPDVFLRQQVYDPTWGDPSYALYAGKRVIPAIGSIVKDPDGTPHWVASLNADYTPVYEDFKISDSAINGVSFYTLDNARFALYVDTRSSPYPVVPDGKLIIEGVSPRSYRLTRYAGTPQATVISQYRDTSGNYTSQSIPLVQLSNTLNLWYMPTCYVYPTLSTNEEILVEIMDETGLVIRTATMFVANSVFVNDAMIYRPMIMSMTVTANQMLANGQCYLYQNQDLKNLHLTATLTYQDGRTAEVPVGKDNCFLYGEVDFVPSFPGLTQELLVRYYLGSDSSATPAIVDTASQSIFADVTVVVVPNDMKVPVKISLDLVWNTASNIYNPRWMMYFSDGSDPVDVSGYVTVSMNSFLGTPAMFGVSQDFTISVDMAQVDPTAYATSSIYQQEYVVMLRPPTSVVKWLIQDGQDVTRVYGVDNSVTRRPQMAYDSSLKQYFVPTGLFGTSANFLEAFYFNATPIYDARVAAGPTTPTHFRIRESLGFSTIIAAPIALANYGNAFNVLNDTSGLYVNGTVLFEFLTQNTNGSFQTLYGAPVDVVSGTYQGSAPASSGS